MNQIVKISVPEINEIPNLSDINDYLFKKVIESINTKRENQIIERLGHLGYKFKNMDKFLKFLNKRCQLIKKADSECTLLLDEKTVIASWYETYEVNHQRNTIYIVSGKHPNDINNNLR